MSQHEDATGVTVVGIGEVSAAPDLMIADLGVSLRADTVAVATTSSAEQTSAMIGSLRSGGVADGDIRTIQYAIHPEYDHKDNEQRLLGYRVTNTLQVKIRDVPDAGTIIDAAVSAGGSDSTVGTIAFSLEHDQELIHRAREAAWADALAKAKHLAALSGTRLGPVTRIVESGSRPPGPSPIVRMAMADSTPIESGTSTISVSLEVQFGLG
jgi:hypothetical protein